MIIWLCVSLLFMYVYLSEYSSSFYVYGIIDRIIGFIYRTDLSGF